MVVKMPLVCPICRAQVEKLIQVNTDKGMAYVCSSCYDKVQKKEERK